MQNSNSEIIRFKAEKIRVEANEQTDGRTLPKALPSRSRLRGVAGVLRPVGLRYAPKLTKVKFNDCVRPHHTCSARLLSDSAT